MRTTIGTCSMRVGQSVMQSSGADDQVATLTQTRMYTPPLTPAARLLRGVPEPCRVLAARTRRGRRRRRPQRLDHSRHSHLKAKRIDTWHLASLGYKPTLGSSMSLRRAAVLATALRQGVLLTPGHAWPALRGALGPGSIGDRTR
eukprot:1545533-Prymnesium_polylepis.1